MKETPTIHLMAPKDKTKWHPIWHKCYSIWETSPYKIKLWYDEDIDTLLKEDNKEFFNILNTLDKIYKIDYVRYLILEKFGGAYFDMDVELFIDFLPSINPHKIYLMGADSNDEIVQNSIMISSKEHSLFWSDLKKHIQFKIKNNLNECSDLNAVLPIGTIVRQTVGPIILSEYIKSNRSNNSIEVLASQHFNRGSNEIKFSYHHQTGVWGQEIKLNQ